VDTVYIETTVVGHLAGRLHPEPLIAARQHFARRWWPSVSSKYSIFVSQLVVDKCSGGDPSAAEERLKIIAPLDKLEINDDVRNLAAKLIDGGAFPASEPRDAFHVAIAAVHGVQYLVTRNFAHIVNATARARIEATCRSIGFEPPLICTPEELAGEEDHEITDG